MKRLLLILLTAGVIACAARVLPHSSAQADAPRRGSPTHEEWVLKSLQEMNKVKEGMTRADLLKVFGEEGGLSTRTQRTYVYKECRFFKVDVKFEPAERGSSPLAESPDDRITEISRPYLNYSITD